MTTRLRCECGCKEAVAEGKRFRHGHYSRTPAAKRMYERQRMHIPPPNPSGKCQCGCGQITGKSKRNFKVTGEAIGQHQRFLLGHGVRKKGPAHHLWKGGRFSNTYGYFEIYGPEHPHHNSKGYVLEHRLVMEKHLGRLLAPEERVHHINGVRTDNRVTNLVVISRSEHSKIHVKGLTDWAKENPEKAKAHRREAGRKGATAKWGNRKK